MSRTRSGASSGSPHPDRGGQPKDGSQVPRVGSVPRLRLLVQLINGVPGPGESTHLVVPGMRTLLQRLRAHFAQSGTCTGPGRRTQQRAKIRTSPTRLLIIQRRTESWTSGSLVSRPTGVADGLSGPSAPELVTPEPEAGGMVGGLSGPSAPGRAAPEPRLWHGDPCHVRSGRSDRRAAGKGFDDRLGFKVGVREGCEVVHTEVPPCRCRLEDPSLNGDPDLTRPRTEGRRDGLEHSGFEGALRLSGLVFRFRLLRSGLGLEELRCGSPPVRTQLVQQLLTEEVQVQVLQEQAPITSSVNGPPLKFVEDRRGALHRFHLVRLLGLFLGDGGGVEPGLNLEGLHRRRVEGSAFLALFLVAWQWGPLPRWGRQKLLVQLHGAVPDHRPDRGGEEVREAGLVRVLAGHRVGGQLADVHRGTVLEVAGPVRVRAFHTWGPSAPAPPQGLHLPSAHPLPCAWPG